MAQRTGGDDIGAIVINVGSYSTKAGEAGDDTPKAVFPTNVGCIHHVTGNDNYVGQGGSHERAMGELVQSAREADLIGKKGNANRMMYVGTNDLSVFRPNMEILTPISNGAVNDWDAVEKLWDHALMERLRVDPAEHPLLFTEPSINSKDQREKLTELVFERYKPQGFFVAKEATLCAYASGRSTALVVDSGADMTTVAPVHDGYVLQRSTQYSYTGGSKLTELLCSLIQRRYPNKEVKPKYIFTKKQSKGRWEISLTQRTGVTDSYHLYQFKSLLNDIKETLCKVSDEPFEESMTVPVQSYELPDGSVIQLDKERCKVTDFMFLNQTGSPSIQDMIKQSVGLADADIRKELFSGIVIAGGNSLFKGFPERLLKEVQSRNPQSFKIKTIAPTYTPARKFSSWIGGSILASLGSFHQMWISKQEYDEVGKNIVNLKCP